ncbi:MAG: formyl transferase [Gammaproteobacteria bacterium]
MTKPSILILCGSSPRHIYVANKLCRFNDVIAIVQETGTHWSVEKVLKLLSKPNLFFRKVWRWLRDRKRYTGNPEQRFFFGEKLAAFDRPDLIFNVPHINHPDLVDLARRTEPDVIVVFGTSLIKNELLNMGKYGIVNLHGGLSPQYRGADCTFWALYHGEPDQVGCTIHFINRGIDTGKLIAHVCPPVKPNDDELTLFWRAVQESADVYVNVIQRLVNGDRLGQVQTSKGRLFQVKDRGWRQEQQLEGRMREGMLSKFDLPLRVTWFEADN